VRRAEEVRERDHAISIAQDLCDHGVCSPEFERGRGKPWSWGGRGEGRTKRVRLGAYAHLNLIDRAELISPVAGPVGEEMSTVISTVLNLEI
jgi:hypothetical protein